MSSDSVDLSSALRFHTQDLHVQAERSGIVADMLRGRVTRLGYAIFLRNLAPAYRRLEIGLERHRLSPIIGSFARDEIYRSAALEHDLSGLNGPGWREALPLLPAGQRYADHIDAAAAGSGDGLIGHAYVRYLGDLSGGQVLKRLLGQSLGLTGETLAFYDFPRISDPVAYKQNFRDALDRAAATVADQRVVIDAAVEAFSLNIQVSEAARLAAPGGVFA